MKTDENFTEAESVLWYGLFVLQHQAQLGINQALSNGKLQRLQSALNI